MKPTHHCFRSLLLCILTSAGASAQDSPPPATPPAAPVAAAEPAPAANPAADLAAAAEKLAAATSYAWSQTTTFGNMGARTATGKKGSGGYLLVNMPGRDQEIQVLVRKGKAAMKSDEGWAAVDPAAEGQGQGPGRFIARMVQNFQEPATQAKNLVAKATDLKSENGSIHGTLGAEAATELMSMGGFGRRGGGGGGGGGGTPPQVTGAAGKVSFAVSNGVLTGYEMTLTGNMNFNGEDRDVNRVTKVEFTGVGSTSFDIPESAAGALAN
ncbi:MAG: hypothetical protein V4819_17265 [Verrucomicrobiota bacterium]